MNAKDFSAKYLTTEALNGIPFNEIITLGTNQTIKFLKVEGVVSVKEPLRVRNFYTNSLKERNLINLEAERENTVMVR